MGTWLDDIIIAMNNLGGIAKYRDLYDEIQKIRNNPLPKSFRNIIRKNVEYHSSDSIAFQNKDDLFYSVDGLGHGIWGLRRYNSSISPIAIDISNNKLPIRKDEIICRIIRDYPLVKELKILHDFECQICGNTLELLDGSKYAEGHHIQPLGFPHNGPDIRENILILCPNHHALCDFRSIHLKTENLRNHSHHQIDQKYIDYHNSKLFPEKH